jgi:hypothetical protein
MCGSAIGLRPSVFWATSQLSRISSSSICCRMASLNRRRTTASGALPGRKPGRRARCE